MACCLEETLKEKLSKLHCPFTWEILESVIKHTTIRNNSNVKDEEAGDDELYTLELLVKILLKCYKAVISTDDESTWALLTKAEGLLMQIQQEYDIYICLYQSVPFYFFWLILL